MHGHSRILYSCGLHVESECRCMGHEKETTVGKRACPTCSKPHVITESFEGFVEKTPVSIRCKLCKFYRAYETEAEGIKATTRKRGVTFGSGRNGNKATTGAVTPQQIAVYIRRKYPEYQLSEDNVYDHFRHGHEEVNQWSQTSKTF